MGTPIRLIPAGNNASCWPHVGRFKKKKRLPKLLQLGTYQWVLNVYVLSGAHDAPIPMSSCIIPVNRLLSNLFSRARIDDSKLVSARPGMNVCRCVARWTRRTNVHNSEGHGQPCFRVFAFLFLFFYPFFRLRHHMMLSIFLAALRCSLLHILPDSPSSVNSLSSLRTSIGS